MNRKLVIGDIHGGLKALKQVLQRAKFTNADELIFLGDYVDGWSDSAALISFLMALKQTQPCVFLRGNHDDLACQWLETHEHNPTWLEHGGEATKKAYQKISAEDKTQHIHFFKQLQNYHIDKDKRLFVHAGFANLHGPQNEYNAHTVYWDRSLWEMALALNPNLQKDDLFYPTRLKLFKEIFIGHTPTTRIDRDRPVRAANVWNVDTGAAFKGKLSCMDVATKEVFQSDPVYRLYPNEKGRN